MPRALPYIAALAAAGLMLFLGLYLELRDEDRAEYVAAAASVVTLVWLAATYSLQVRQISEAANDSNNQLLHMRQQIDATLKLAEAASRQAEAAARQAETQAQHLAAMKAEIRPRFNLVTQAFNAREGTGSVELQNLGRTEASQLKLSVDGGVRLRPDRSKQVLLKEQSTFWYLESVKPETCLQLVLRYRDVFGEELVQEWTLQVPKA